MNTVRQIVSVSVLLGLLGGTAKAALRLHWPLEEGSGTNIAELVTGSNDVANLSTDAAWVAGIAPGSTWAFQSQAGQYVNAGSLMPSGDYLPGYVTGADLLGNNYTIMAWIKWDVTGAQTLISSKWNIPAFDLGTYNNDGDFRCYLNGNNAFVTTGMALQVGTTYLVVVQYDKDMTTGDLSPGMRARVLYWDGTNWQAEENSINVPGARMGDMTIGCFSSGRGRNFRGIVDDVRIYDHTMTLAELGAFVGDKNPPAAPTGLGNNVLGATSVLLDWDDSPEADLGKYTLYRSETQGSGYSEVADDLTESTFTDTGLTEGTTYYYVVTASDASGNESGYSNESSAAPLTDDTPPAAPTGLTANGVSFSGVTLDWDDNGETDFASYSLYRSTTSGGGYTLVADDLTESNYADSGLNELTTYYYVVTATDYADNESANSSDDDATTLEAPTDPDLLLWWKLDEGAGSITAEQMTGQPDTATLVGALTWTTGIAPDGGNAILFADTDPASFVEAGTLKSDGTYVPDNLTDRMYLGDSWTMTAWVKLTDPQGTTGTRSILSVNWGNSGGDFMWQLRNADNELWSEARINGPYYSDINLTPGQVYLVAWQADPTSAVLGAGVQSRYMAWDGTNWQSSTFATCAEIDMQRIQIGQYPGREFRGVIDDVRIYKKTLTDEELTELLQLPPPPADGTMILIK